MANFDEIVFKKKRFSDILEDIYNRSTSREKQLVSMIDQLKELITNIGDATMMVPLIAKYMELNLKNDDVLVKMAAIVQSAIGRGKETGDSSLSDREKEELLKLAQEASAERAVNSKKQIGTA